MKFSYHTFLISIPKITRIVKTMSSRIPGIKYWYNATRPALIKESMQVVSISYTTKIILTLVIFQNHTDFGSLSCIVSTDYCLYSKCACTTTSWCVSTSDIGVVGDSGAAATV